LLNEANVPVAVLELPLKFFKSVPAPVAVFSSAVLRRSAAAPMAVLKLPSVTAMSEYKPIAVLYVAVVRLRRADVPSAVFPPG
jgi:hypothetical protein